MLAAWTKLEALFGNALTSSFMKFSNAPNFFLLHMKQLKIISEESSNYTHEEYIWHFKFLVTLLSFFQHFLQKHENIEISRRLFILSVAQLFFPLWEKTKTTTFSDRAKSSVQYDIISFEKYIGSTLITLVDR
jgi:hypothetical protein